jgi:hypothetical protein
LVSSRRQPAANQIDLLWTPEPRLYRRSDDRLGVLVENHCLDYDPATEHWTARQMPLTGTNKFWSLSADYTSEGGAQRLLTGAFARRYLVGFGNDDRPATSWLMEATRISTFSPPAEKLLPPLRWDWPESYPMEHSQILADGEIVWVLAPRTIYPVGSLTNEPVTFTDNRQATLLRFTLHSRQPLAAAVCFPDHGMAERPRINGQPMGLFDPRMFGFRGIMDRLSQHVGNMTYWLRTPEGLVLGGPEYCGHWLIPVRSIESNLRAVTGGQDQKPKSPPNTKAP